MRLRLRARGRVVYGNRAKRGRSGEPHPSRRAARECERLAEYTMGLAQEKGLSGPWVPVVSDDVQVIDGVEFRRMLPPERMLEEDDD